MTTQPELREMLARAAAVTLERMATGKGDTETQARHLHQVAGLVLVELREQQELRRILKMSKQGAA